MRAGALVIRGQPMHGHCVDDDLLSRGGRNADRIAWNGLSRNKCLFAGGGKQLRAVSVESPSWRGRAWRWTDKEESNKSQVFDEGGDLTGNKRARLPGGNILPRNFHAQSIVKRGGNKQPSRLSARGTERAVVGRQSLAGLLIGSVGCRTGPALACQITIDVIDGVLAESLIESIRTALRRSSGSEPSDIGIEVYAGARVLIRAGLKRGPCTLQNAIGVEYIANAGIRFAQSAAIDPGAARMQARSV